MRQPRRAGEALDQRRPPPQYRAPPSEPHLQSPTFGAGRKASLPGTHPSPCLSLVVGGPREFSCPNVPQVLDSCRAAPARPDPGLPRAHVNHRIQEMASMSKSQDSATHKGMGCLRAARHTCSALWLPLPSMAVTGTQVTGGCAGSGLEQTAAASSSSARSPRGPAQRKWEVPSAGSHHSGGPRETQRLLPGPQCCVAAGQGWAE